MSMSMAPTSCQAVTFDTPLRKLWSWVELEFEFLGSETLAMKAMATS